MLDHLKVTFFCVVVLSIVTTLFVYVLVTSKAILEGILPKGWEIGLLWVVVCAGGTHVVARIEKLERTVKMLEKELHHTQGTLKWAAQRVSERERRGSWSHTRPRDLRRLRHHQEE